MSLLALTAALTAAPAAGDHIGRIYTYVRSDRDGAEAETIHVFRESRTRIGVAKMRSRCTNAAYVTADLDLERGWRITMPNLEQTGLLRIDYEDLDWLAARPERWQSAHAVLRGADPALRAEVARTLLDHMRRALAVDVQYFRDDFDTLQRASEERLAARVVEVREEDLLGVGERAAEPLPHDGEVLLHAVVGRRDEPGRALDTVAHDGPRSSSGRIEDSTASPRILL